MKASPTPYNFRNPHLKPYPHQRDRSRPESNASVECDALGPWPASPLMPPAPPIFPGSPGWRPVYVVRSNAQTQRLTV
ncbi:hypothetical protein Q5H93_12585 [Hymenobacter sp. ASUV-10]|uniref:Uncharacterized protein n=1 Tax=Hymenobacter aranciens TaxID=3063996 RepID=A0ABT9BBD2_9BACT|nr:hypothetical protein [Hymenobacter sp. ASUV-10]MDO7875572.1 hypothetical protein [Hymenobacter sp. ASUV-10]